MNLGYRVFDLVEHGKGEEGHRRSINVIGLRLGYMMDPTSRELPRAGEQIANGENSDI